MSLRFAIIAFSIICIVGIAGFVFKLLFSQSNQSAPQNKRQSDSRKLSPHEKKIFNQAQSLLSQGSLLQAAQLLESINCQRDAIQILENAGHIHEAGKVLMRMGLADRAGFIYARHKQWDRALESFKLAGKHLEVANCAVELEKHDIAAENFAKAGEYEKAADSFVLTGKHAKAAEMYIKADKTEEAIAQFQNAAQKGQTVVKTNLEREAVKAIANYLAKGHADINLARIINNEPVFRKVIFKLASTNKLETAIILYKAFDEDPSTKLLEEVNYDDENTALGMAKIFSEVGQYNYAGTIYEKNEKYASAARLFEKGGEIERAIECYQRDNNQLKADELHGKLLRGEFKKSALPEFQSKVFSIKMLDDIEKQDQNEQPLKATGSDGVKLRRAASVQEAVATNVVSTDQAIEKAGSANVDKTKFEDTSSFRSLESVLTGNQAEVVASHSLHNRPLEVSDDNLDSFQLFRKTSLLTDLNEIQALKIWRRGETFDYEEGRMILEFDNEPQGFYVVLEGKIGCFRIIAGEPSEVDEIKSGETFGELWLLSDHPTKVRFVAKEPTKIRIIKRDRFISLLDEDGAIARKVYKKFSSRLLQRLFATTHIHQDKIHGL